MSIQSSSNNNQFTWIKFYMELADKLLTFKNRRKELLKIIYSLDDSWVRFLHLPNGKKYSDIDPFSVYSIFNRGILNSTRIAIAKEFKKIFGIKSPTPVDFTGIPIMNNQSATFFYRDNVATDISPLWELFEAAIRDSKDFIPLFDKARSQRGIKWNITIALYWIRPYEYMTLDGYSRDYLSSKGVEVLSEQDLTGDMYLDFINSLRYNSQFRAKDFPTISRDAWRKSHSLDNQEEGIIVENNESLIEDNDFNKTVNNITKVLSFKKNVILQGAPGTGKTYITAAVALKILGIKDVDYNNHAAVMEKYNKYLEDGNIFFTTFHQSMDYEDFVEGLKPKIDKDDEGNSLVTYEVEDGIFKDVCNCAYGEDNRDFDEDESDNESESDEFNITNEDHTVWKVILGGTKDNKIREKCLKDGLIAVGWGYGDVDFSTYKFPNVPNNGSKALPAIQNEMKKGDIVVSEYKTEFFDAIGIIQGNYQFVANAIIENTDFTYTRKVKWIYKGKRKIRHLNNNFNFNRDTVCRLPKINRQKLNNFLAKYKNVEEQTENISEEQEGNNTNSPVILIIDEINRGNVSKIFGELVTLLEKDKREGEDHPITVTLPYSKEDFSVPSNVYIIGTMNTTDRSTGTLDYAIRRRFAFVTLPADREAIQLDIAKELFDDIELFIEDNCPKDMDIADLMVGHSYFMTEDEDELELKIKYEVVPLLKEYCNDGLLTCSQEELNERIEAWENLEVFDDSSVETEDEDNEEDEDQE